jgi:hypothetical protein
MQSIAESESRPKSRVTLLELAMVVSVVGATTAGIASFYAGKSDELLAAGTARLVKTLNTAQMNEACPEQAYGTAPNCRMFGDYRVRRTHDDSWTISRVESGEVGEKELVLVSGGKMYVNERYGARQLMSAKFEAIKGVVGKSAREIAAEKG